MKKITFLMTMLLVSFTSAWGDTWDGTSSASLKQEENTYLIQSAADLAYFAQNPTNGSYKLTVDIDLNGDNYSWTPVATFGGTFDGDNHTISNMKVTTNSGDGGGLFSSIWLGKVKNIKLRGCTITAVANKNFWGILSGQLGGTNSSMSNCSVENSTLTVAGGCQHSGLLVGKAVNTKIQNCFVTNSTLTPNAQQTAGGLVGGGGANAATITNCFVYDCTMKISTGGQANQGLFIGNCNSKLVNCYIYKDAIKATGENIATGLTGQTVTEKTLADFATPELAWNLNTTNSTVANTGIWSHNGTYPVFADANNYPTYKMDATIYKGSEVTNTAYTSAPDDAITAIKFNSTDIPQDSLKNLGGANCLIYVGSLDYTGDNVIKESATPNIVLTDGAPFYCPIAINDATVSYTRKFAEGWNTMCLPFAYTVGEDVDKIENLTAGTAESVSFEYITDVTIANTPYLINIAEEGNKEFEATGVTIPTSETMNDPLANGYIFKGTFATSTVTGGYGLVLDATTSTVMFKKIPDAGKELTSFRAYLAGAYDAPNNAPALSIIHGNGGGTTGINDAVAENDLRIYANNGSIEIVSGKAQQVNMFSIDGRLVRTIDLTEGTNTIPAISQGIYLINNQKVLVK